MLHFMPDVRSSNIIVKPFRIIFNYDLALTFALVLSFYELFLYVFITKRLNKGAEFFFLIVPR